MKNVIIAGASGMVGSLVLDRCLENTEVQKVISLVRKKSQNSHPKIQEEIIKDFSDFSANEDLFNDVDVAFFCIGVYTGQVPDDQFKEITVDYPVAFAQALKHKSPNASLCLLSGAGADRSEKSRTPFARYKGMAENKLSEMNLGAFHTLRPGYIYPVTPRKEPNVMYRITRFLYPVLRRIGPNGIIKSTELAEAMFFVGMNGADSEVLENRDILKQLKDIS